MAVARKIFTNFTPSGKAHIERRRSILEKCKELGHTMAEFIKAKKKDTNFIEWACTKCGHSVKMDFLSDSDFGGAIVHECPNRS